MVSEEGFLDGEEWQDILTRPRDRYEFRRMAFAEWVTSEEKGKCCYYCGKPAESQCPICQKWTCWEDRRDFPPNFDEHWCPDCVGKHHAMMKEEKSR